MKIDNTKHPISQMAARVFFACFMSIVLLGFATVMVNHAMRAAWFQIWLGVTSFFLLSAVVTYFRPKGIFVLITAIPMALLVLAFEVYAMANDVGGIHSSWQAALVGLASIVGLVVAFRYIRDVLRRAREFEKEE